MQYEIMTRDLRRKIDKYYRLFFLNVIFVLKLKLLIIIYLNVFYVKMKKEIIYILILKVHIIHMKKQKFILKIEKNFIKILKRIYLIVKMIQKNIQIF